jgi:hypothetical protein
MSCYCRAVNGFTVVSGHLDNETPTTAAATPSIPLAAIPKTVPDPHMRGLRHEGPAVNDHREREIWPYDVVVLERTQRQKLRPDRKDKLKTTLNDR